MIYVTINEKGGVGKSTLAFHFLTSYLLQKKSEKLLKDAERKGSPLIRVFEFDEHNKTKKNFSNDFFMEVESVSLDTGSMEEAFSNIEFYSDEEDVILDIGGSQNTYKFLDMLSESSLRENVLFIVPDTNSRSEGLENTISRILECNNGRKDNIIVALNGASQNIPMEEDFIFYFGSKNMDIPPSWLSQDKDIKVGIIGENRLALSLSELSRVSLFSLARDASGVPSDTKGKRLRWSTEQDSDGKDIPCSQEVFVERMRFYYRGVKGVRALSSATSFFALLDQHRDAAFLNTLKEKK